MKYKHNQKLIAVVIIFTIIAILLSTMACTTNQNAILSGINQIRLNNGLNQLQESQELDDFANYRLKKMQNPSHEDFKSDYITFMQKSVNLIGEIIAYGDIKQSTEAYLNAWMNSPSHKKVIVYPCFNSFGIAEGIINGNYIIIVEFDLTQY
jgi:uncharacterized protein YkwD